MISKATGPMQPRDSRLVYWAIFLYFVAYQNHHVMKSAKYLPTLLRMSVFSAILFLSSFHGFTQSLAKPDIRILGDTVFCTGGEVQLVTTKVPGVHYTWLKNLQFISGGGVDDTAYKVTTSGVYSVRASNGSDSITSRFVSVVVLPYTPPSISANGPTSVCSDEHVVLNSSSPAGNTWYRNGILQGIEASLMVYQTGMYYLYVPGECGTHYDSIYVTIGTDPRKPRTPAVYATGDTTFCSGGSVLLKTSRLVGYSFTYQWLRNGSLIPGATDSSYRAMTSGAYVVRVYSSCSGDSTPSRNITVAVSSPQDTAKITANGPVDFCNGDSVALTSNSANGNKWYLNNTLLGTGKTYTARSTGLYKLYTGASCGVSHDSIDVTVASGPAKPQKPAIYAIGDTQLCPGRSVLLKTGYDNTNSLTYKWLRDGLFIPGATDSSYTAYRPGLYSLRVYSICSGDSATSNNIKIVTDTAHIIASGPLSFCAGDSVVLSSTAANGNIWYIHDFPVGNAPQFVANQSGSIILLVYNTCSTTRDTVYVTVAPGPIKPRKPGISAAGDTTLCPGTSVLLKTDFIYLNSLTYKWFKDGAIVPGSTDSTYTATEAGSYFVKAYSTCSGDSTASRSITVTMDPTGISAKITANGPVDFCSSDSVVLASSSPVGNNWYFNGTPLGPGNLRAAYWTGSYKLSVTNACGITSDSIYINVASGSAKPEVPRIYATGDTVLCTGSSVLLKTPSSTWNTSLYFKWFRNGIMITGATDSSYNAASSGVYTVKAYSICSGDSASSRGLTVLVTPPTAVAHITPDGPISFCNGDSVILASSAVSGNKWYIGNSLVSTASILTARWTGLYTLYVAAGCGNLSDTIRVSVASGPVRPPSPDIFALGDTTFCSGGSVLLKTPSQPYNTAIYFRWFRNGMLIQGATDSSYRAFEGGLYLVKAYSTCSGDSGTSATIMVAVSPPGEAASITANGPLVFCSGGSVVLTSSNATTYQWYRDGTPLPGANSKNYTATQTGVYYNIISTTCGNGYDHDSVRVVVNPTPAIGDITATPSVIYSFDHQMVTIEIAYTGAGTCPTSNCTLSIASNEPQSGQGDGDIGGDWEIVNNHEIKVRAERFNNVNGRIYTVSVTCTDSIGNSYVKKTTVSVPKNGFDAIILQNPSSSEFRFLISSIINTPVSLRVYKSNGLSVETRSNIIPNTTISVGSNYPNGLYYLEFSQGGSRKTFTILKL